MNIYASKFLVRERILPLTKAERRTYSATETGERLGITAHKVGLLANKNNLDTDEYGVWVHDKSQIQSFHCYDEVIPVLKELTLT